MEVTHNTLRGRLLRGAVIGAVVLNIPTLVWGWRASTSTLIAGIIVAAVLGAALGAVAAWSVAPNRWDRWWTDHRRRPRGSGRTFPPPDEMGK